MEALAVELEDDVFFADLSKQISLLIMDDDEDPITHSPSLSLQGFSQSIRPTPQTPFVYDQQTCKRESKGTGVFIPRSSQPARRKNRQGRYSTTSYNSSNSKFQKNQDHNSRGLFPHHVSYNYKASYDSFVDPRKF